MHTSYRHSVRYADGVTPIAGRCNVLVFYGLLLWYGVGGFSIPIGTGAVVTLDEA